MHSRHTIRAVRADYREISHADLARRRLFYQADAFDATIVARELGPDLIEKPAINLVNDLQLPGQKGFKPRNRPLLERFRQESVVGVGQGFSCKIPGLIPAEVRVVQQNTHQFSDRHRRMGIIELNRGPVGQLFPIRVMPQEASHQVSQRARHQKILLQEAEFLSRGGGIVRIQNARQRFCFEGPTQRAHKIAGTKLLKIEIIGSSRGPEAQSVDRLSSVTHDWAIERYSEQDRRTIWDHFKTSVSHLETAVQLDFDFLMRASNFPWVTVAHPVVRIFLLPAVHKRLSKHAVLVSQTVASCRKLHGSHRVEEAGSESAKTSVAKAGVRFLLDQFKPVDTFLFDHTLDYRIKQKVCDVIGQRTPKKKFHGEVVNAFSILLLVRDLRLHPALGHDVTHRVCESFEAFPGTGCSWVDRAIENQVPIVKRIRRSGKLNRIAVLLKNLWNAVPFRDYGNDCGGT